MTPPVSQGFGYSESIRGVWHHQDRRRRGPRELTGIVDLTHGKAHPTAARCSRCWEGSAPCTRTGWPCAEKKLFGFEGVGVVGRVGCVVAG